MTVAASATGNGPSDVEKDGRGKGRFPARRLLARVRGRTPAELGSQTGWPTLEEIVKKMDEVAVGR